MALEVTKLFRVFKIKDKDGKWKELTDPNPSMRTEEVMKFYSAEYPQLTNAIVEGPKVEGGKAHYILKTEAGQLG
jgi:PRTRC genetic system protein C